jgi:hypothetical protein
VLLQNFTFSLIYAHSQFLRGLGCQRVWDCFILSWKQSQ